MAKTGWHRAAATLGLVSAIVWAAAQAGCGADAQQAPTDSDGGDSGNSAPDGMPGDETVFVGADGGGPVTSISIIPASPIVDVTIDKWAEDHLTQSICKGPCTRNAPDCFSR